ncbi:hypothetical protein GDO86_014020 [Hymenochirus boettgeri]|uniref:Coiled-coil domain-containing protein 57 n=1 Tax=Hymenochirus boettgeri TaxID=247094 RepID=A0A8T2JST5_9PIPI|nr:hypothetical protein GDO86_014020 [Hymenochirus boettgeri]
MLPEEEEFSKLLAKKEQEWRELQHRQVQFLEKSLKDTKKELREQNEKFLALKNDFTHNLKVLAERDRELEQFEMMFNHLKVVENGKQSEISDLKIQIQKFQQEIQKEKKKFDNLQVHYQRKLKEHQIDLERIQSSKNHDIDHHREEYEKVKRQLERKIEEVQGDLALQKQEMMVEFDAEMKRREHEYRLQMDEMSTMVLAHELKVKFLTKELEVLREGELQTLESVQNLESTNQKLQEDLTRKDWEINDLSVVKDARIKELQNNVKSLQEQHKKQGDSFQRKHEQLDHFAREKESALKSMKEAHAEQVQQMEKQIKELQMCTETLQMEQRRTQSSQQDILAEKETMIEKLKEEVNTLRTGWDNYISQISKESVNKDLQIQSIQEEMEKLKAQITRYQKDIEKYQQQLVGSVDRERILEQAKIQSELDWQKRCELVEKTQYQQSEDLIESLTKAKEQSFAIEAIQELQKMFPSDEIRKLQEQNSELRNVIGQMRNEMESLYYVQPLEDEMRNLKQKNREMEEKCLRADKVSSVAVTKRLEARTVHLDSMVSQLTQKLHNKATSRRDSESTTAAGRIESPSGSSSNSQVYMLSNKLKEAAKKISQLSLEKQQLIDMGNRLRAELASTEENQPQMSRLSPSEIQVPEAENRLLALENLQYELTCQELQYAQYQKSSSIPAKESSGFRAKKNADIHGMPELAAVRSYPGTPKLEHKENKYPVDNETIVPSSNLASSFGEVDSSLQDVWKLLDMGSSPSLISSQEESKQAYAKKSPQMATLNGISTTDPGSQRAQKERTFKPTTVRQGKPKGSQSTTKIRNYNIRD